MTWNLPRGEEFLPHTSFSELKRRMQAEHGAKPRLRFLIALHRKQGKSLDEISEACGVPRRTVHGTLERFVEKGTSAVHAVKQSGRPKRLNVAQLRGLRARLLRPPSASNFTESFWSTRLVLALVKREYHVEYDASHLRRLLHELGFSVKTPRPKHYKSSPREVAAFKKKRGSRFSAQDGKGEPRFAWTSAASSSRHTRREVGLPEANPQ